MATTEEFDHLVEDLRQAAARPMSQLYKQPGDWDEQQQHPTLARVVRHIAGEPEWHRSPNQALILVMRKAISQLPEEMSGRPPRGDKGGNRNFWRGAPEMHMAEVMYGYRDDELPARFNKDGDRAHPTYTKDRLPYAMTFAGNAKTKSMTRITRVICEDLADILFQREREALARKKEAESRGSSRPYVSRLDLEREIEDSLRESNLVVIWGDAGTGKSMLAQHMAHELARGGEVVSINMNDTRAMCRSLEGYLRIKNLLPEYWNEMVLMGKFYEHLSDVSAPRVVIFDNLENETAVSELLPGQHTSLVLVTCRRQMLQDQAARVNVASMSRDQATAMVESRLPDLPHEDAARLAEVLGDRPLAIEHGCAYLASLPLDDRSRDVERFVGALQQDLPRVLEDLDGITEPDLTLVQIYKLILAQLTSQRLRLLDFILLFGNFVDIELLQGVWAAEGFFIGTDDRALSLASDTRAHLALGVLMDYALVTLSDNQSPARVVIHPLTAQILAYLRRDEIKQAAHETLQLAENVPEARVLAAQWSVPSALSRRVNEIGILLPYILADSKFLTETAILPRPNIAAFASLVLKTCTETSTYSTVVPYLHGVYLMCRQELRTHIENRMHGQKIQARLEDSHLLGRELVRFHSLFATVSIEAELESWGLGSMVRTLRERYMRTWRTIALTRASDWQPACVIEPSMAQSKELMIRSAEADFGAGRFPEPGVYLFARSSLLYELGEWKLSWHYGKQALTALERRGLSHEATLCWARAMKIPEYTRNGRTSIEWADIFDDGPNMLIPGFPTHWSGASWLLRWADSRRSEAMMCRLQGDTDRARRSLGSAQSAYDAADAWVSDPRSLLRPAIEYGKLCLFALAEPQRAVCELVELRNAMYEWNEDGLISAIRCDLAIVAIQLGMYHEGLATAAYIESQFGLFRRQTRNYERFPISPYWIARARLLLYAHLVSCPDLADENGATEVEAELEGRIDSLDWGYGRFVMDQLRDEGFRLEYFLVD